MRINFQIIQGWEERFVKGATGFLDELLATEENAQVQAILAEFPGGRQIDKDCITITQEGVKVLNGLDKTLTTYEDHYTAVKAGIAAQIAQAKAGNPKKGFARFLAIAGAWAHNLANLVTGQ